ncbi:MAG TPA: hypothetical protein DD473_04615, partial [Planctomycetaceae bacterium]|nr:hypothetical protein [Planctomycetaceae bacterium]
SQRAAIAANMKSFKRGEVGNGRKVDPQNCSSTKTTKEIAESLGVSERSIANARLLKERGSEELQQSVSAGEVSLSRAVQVVKSAVPRKNHLKAAKTKWSTKSKETQQSINKKTGEFNMGEQFVHNVARVAITQLESIPLKNQYRINALTEVMEYIEQQISEAST